MEENEISEGVEYAPSEDEYQDQNPNIKSNNF